MTTALIIVSFALIVTWVSIAMVSIGESEQVKELEQELKNEKENNKKMYENKILDKNGNEIVKIGNGCCWVVEKEKNELEKIKNRNQELQHKIDLMDAKLEKMSEQNKDLKMQIKALLDLQRYQNNEK